MPPHSRTACCQLLHAARGRRARPPRRAAWLRCAARMVRQLPSNVRYVYRSQSPRPVRLMM
jgi:hypothetical protein